MDRFDWMTIQIEAEYTKQCVKV